MRTFIFGALLVLSLSLLTGHGHVNGHMAGSKAYTLPNNAGFLEFTWSSEESNEEQDFSSETGGDQCDRLCRGQKHFAHRTCDASCDESCKKLHVMQHKPYVSGEQGYYSMGRELGAGASRFGASFDAEATARSTFLEAFPALSDPANVINTRSGCWNEKPCTLSTRRRTYKATKFKFGWQLYRFDQAEAGRQVRVQGPKGEVSGKLWIPQPGPLKQEDFVSCSCEIAVEEPRQSGTGGTRTQTTGGSGATTGGSTPTTTGTTGGGFGTGASPFERGWTPGTGSGAGANLRIGFVCMNYEQGEPIDRKFLNDVGFQVSIPNINICQVTATNPTPKPLRFTVCAGVMFVCISGGGQDMLLVQDLRFNIPALGEKTLSLKVIRPDAQVQIGRQKLDPNAPTKMPLEARVLCLNIEKRAPTSADTFGVALPPSREVAAIANKTMIQAIQGPWDQARIWIAKDATTFDQVNKRLIPPIAAAQYVRCLQECWEWGRIDFTSEQYRKCLEPKLALGIEAGPKAMVWFGKTASQADASALADFVKSHLADFAAKYSDAKALDHADRIAALASGMISSGNPACADAGFDLLLKGMPEAGRSRFAKHKGLSELTAFLVSSDDSALVSKALDVVEALKPNSATIGLLNLRPSVSQALKDRAKSLAAGLN